MKIVPIFDEKLYAIQYDGEEHDEFRSLFILWHDTEWLEDFFEENIMDLQAGFFGNIAIEEAILETINNADYLEEIILDSAENSGKEQMDGLDQVFKPLHNSQIRILHLNKSKSRYNWLRIYALKIDDNAYLITGGAIKLTQKMQDRAHTHNELIKLNRCRDYLLEEGIIDLDGMIEEVES